MTAWSKWEDWNAGLYDTNRYDADRVTLSADLLADSDHFREVAREMVREWPNATFHNLTHMWSGRNAWLGQAACCYAHKATAAETREAWGRLTNAQQDAANHVARTVRSDLERGIKDAETLFGV